MKYWVAVIAILLLALAVIGVLWFDPSQDDIAGAREKIRERPSVAGMGAEVTPVESSPNKLNASQDLRDEFKALILHDLPETKSRLEFFENLPPFASEGNRPPDDTDLVIGVRIKEQVTAYPLRFMSGRRMVVNDGTTGDPVGAFWDADSKSLFAFSRTVDGISSRFQLAESRWQNVPLLVDEKTESVWSPFFTFGIHGQLKGSEWSLLPITITTWREWLDANPRTRFMFRPPDFSEDTTGNQIFGTGESLLEQAIVVVDAGRSILIPLASFTDRSLIEINVEDRTYVAIFDRSLQLAVVFDRRLGDQILELEQDKGKLIDTKSGTQFRASSGNAISGTLESKTLRRLPFLFVHAETWKSYHSKTIVITP